MRYVLFILIVAGWVGFHFYSIEAKKIYCEELSLKQYRKRQFMLTKSLATCGMTNDCLQEAIQLTDYLVRFDRQVRIEEGCEK